MKVIISTFALLGAAVAAPQYHAAPAYHVPLVHAAPVYKEVPSPYTYQYGVHDDYSGANYNAGESADGNGNVEGSYTVALPDGRTQTVSYHADDYAGYVADVTYDGAPQYAAVHAAPVIHAAPAYHAPVVHAAPVYHAPVIHAAPVYHAPVVHAAPAYHAPVYHG